LFTVVVVIVAASVVEPGVEPVVVVSADAVEVVVPPVVVVPLGRTSNR
jgi:hypothetical protein